MKSRKKSSSGDNNKGSLLLKPNFLNTLSTKLIISKISFTTFFFKLKPNCNIKPGKEINDVCVISYTKKWADRQEDVNKKRLINKHMTRND